VTAIKLYNSGSFFDPLAIPPGDHPAIAAELRPFERIIVESHPSLIGASVLRFRDRLRGKLEVAMGLETVHPEILPRLNKRMTLEQFARAADFLHTNDIALRVFILLKLPFLHDEAESLEWAKRSLDFAFECHATAAAVIPTRPGNGALDTLAAQGLFSPPHVATLEAAVDYGICLNQGRVFADLWDLEQFQSCTKCFQDRKNRLAKTNREQVLQPPITCSCASRTSTHENDAC
jgi:radical SAM enzyme (TIGR01210 family)